MRKLKDGSIGWRPASEKNWINLLLLSFIELLQFKKEAIGWKIKCQPSENRKRIAKNSHTPQLHKLDKEIALLREMYGDKHHKGWEEEAFIRSLADGHIESVLAPMFTDSSIVDLPNDGSYYALMKRNALKKTQFHIASKFNVRLMNAENDYLGIPLKVFYTPQRKLKVVVGTKQPSGAIVKEKELNMRNASEDNVFDLIRLIRKIGEKI